jgi:superfamily II DNA/RNA helicase
MQLEDYIHRVGRTGRAGRKGISYTFFTRGNYKYASGLIDVNLKFFIYERSLKTVNRGFQMNFTKWLEDLFH